MPNYNFQAAKRFIQMHADIIEEASLGILEDWGCTADVVYEGSKFNIELDRKGVKIVGIDSSSWGTPSLHILYKDGTEEMKECFTGTATCARPEYFRHGVISKPIQEEIDIKFRKMLTSPTDKLEYNSSTTQQDVQK